MGPRHQIPKTTKYHMTVLQKHQWHRHQSFYQWTDNAIPTSQRHEHGHCSLHGDQHELATTNHKTVERDTLQTDLPQRHLRIFITQHAIITVVSWWFLVGCNDGLLEWVSLKDLKDGSPIELSDYVIAHDIAEEPAFSWWIHHVQKRRYKIVKKLKAKYWQLTHKFGVKMPKSVNDALQLDQENGNDMWEQAIIKKMGKAKVAYEPNKEGFTAQEIQEKKPDTMIGYQEIKCHIIFDVKMDFSRKA
jgi:hypothetical protein